MESNFKRLQNDCPLTLRCVRDHGRRIKIVVAVLVLWTGSFVVTSARADLLESAHRKDTDLPVTRAESPQPQRAQKRWLFEIPRPNVPARAVGQDRKQIVFDPVDFDYRSVLVAVQTKVRSRCCDEVAQSRCSVLFNLRKDGSIFNLMVVRSCGDFGIDEKAKSTIAEAAPFVPLPVGSEDVQVQFTFDEKLEKPN